MAVSVAFDASWFGTARSAPALSREKQQTGGSGIRGLNDC